MKRRTFFRTLGAVGAAGALPQRALSAASSAENSICRLVNQQFAVEIDATTGSLIGVRDPQDPAEMNWISGPDNAPWQSRVAQWGLGYADIGPAFMHRARWETPASFIFDGSAQSARSTYHVGTLEITVTRTLRENALQEQYHFANRGVDVLPMAGNKNALAIMAPFNDHYTNSQDVMDKRCHAHLWMGGASAWVATLRMGGRGPHLGMVTTVGSLSGYSVIGRDDVTGSNTRGTFLLHPDIAGLKPGETREVAWTLFWHDGWEDFFAQCSRHSGKYLRLEARRYTAFVGEQVPISVRGARLNNVSLKNGQQDIPLAAEQGALHGEFSAVMAGEHKLTLTAADGSATRLVLNVVPPIEKLLEARVRFIAQHQQVKRTDDPAAGAFVVFDNETDVQVRRDKVAARDRNEARERAGMGVLLARWLRTQDKKDADLMAALTRYMQFVSTRLQQPDGYVRDSVSSAAKRLYNWPWVAHLHLEYALLTGEDASWRSFVRTIENYYMLGGDRFYAIGLPVYEGLNGLKQAGRMEEYRRLLALFENHASRIEHTGTRYPESEVNYEQAIVAPPAIFLLELHLVTGAQRWLSAARPHLALLELFNGRQPDHHLHEVAIRHWDGYWFGKRQLWGDTFPHYWSTLTALAFHRYSQVTGDQDYHGRADHIIRNNLSLFSADGRASAAFIYPVSVNGQKAHVADPYANDQDWALVHAMQLGK